jgi:uncharacterized protein (DUF362 family)
MPKYIDVGIEVGRVERRTQTLQYCVFAAFLSSQFLTFFFTSMSCISINFTTYQTSVPEILDRLEARAILAQQRAILIKPNLVNSSPHPVTTPVACCEAVVQYVRACAPDAELVIAEGCGDSSRSTSEIFRIHGYTDMAKRNGVALIDLNTAPLKKLRDPQCSRFPEIYLPELAFTYYIISVPVLKAHSIAEMTGTLKNMMGFVPPKHYGGSWKKSAFHRQMQQSLIDLNRYRRPDLSLLDASVGLAEFHLGGAHCSPPPNMLIAGYEPVEVDREAARLLGLKWQHIPHVAVTYTA